MRIRKKMASVFLVGFVTLALSVTSFGGMLPSSAWAAVSRTENTGDNVVQASKLLLGGAVKNNAGQASQFSTGKTAQTLFITSSPTKSTVVQSKSVVSRLMIRFRVPTQTTTKTQAPATTQPANSTPVVQPAQQQSQPTTTSPSLGLTTDEQRAVDLMNADRSANGLPALKVNSSLVTLAREYAQDMINRNFFSHYDPEGRSPFDRMREHGITYRYAGENLAINRSVDAAEVAFMNSPGHRANILNPNYKEIGIGVRHNSNGSVYVVQEFIGR